MEPYLECIGPTFAVEFRRFAVNSRLCHVGQLDAQIPSEPLRFLRDLSRSSPNVMNLTAQVRVHVLHAYTWCQSFAYWIR